MPPGARVSVGCAVQGHALVNARVECEPVHLERLVDAAVEEANRAASAAVSDVRGQAFSPAAPRPTHRLSRIAL